MTPSPDVCRYAAEHPADTRFIDLQELLCPAGLCAPVGLGYGSFTVAESPEGKKLMVNNYGNKGLFKGLPAAATISKALSTAGVQPETQGPVEYDSFVRLVKQLNQQ